MITIPYRKSILPLSAWPEENARAPKARDLMYFTRPYLYLVHSALSADDYGYTPIITLATIHRHSCRAAALPKDLQQH